MGGNSSSIVISLEQTEEELTELMMPLYYVKDLVVTDYDISMARASWKAIVDGASPAFEEAKKNPDFTAASCLTWFYDCFFSRLFDVNPAARPMFKTNLQSLGRVLMGLISTALNQLKDPSTFEKTLINLAHSHSKRGVRGVQYGIMGDVLFWTLRKCLGTKYDNATSHSWTKIFSYMLKIIVPIAVADEITEVKAREKKDKIASESSLSGRTKKNSISKYTSRSNHMTHMDDNSSNHTILNEGRKSLSGRILQKKQPPLLTKNSLVHIDNNEVVPFDG